MKIEQLYTNCLAQGAYFIESDGEAAVIDPLREIDTYLKLAEENGAGIKYIFETHFHADFVSGHIALAEATGATIVYGPNAQTKFKAHIAQDEEVFDIGRLRIKLLHTPGHTLESSCYLLEDEQRKPAAVFTGDTLFIGDVGRPDLAQQPVAGLTQEHLAGMLYDSLRKKIITLPDEIRVYPAHGAGSACGKNLSRETWDTLGNQKKYNYALNAALSREDFITELTADLKPAPAYFHMNARLNSEGYTSPGLIKPLNAPEFAKLSQNNDVLILDTRPPESFAAGHITGAINIGLNGSFAPWVGALLPYDKPILLITEPGREQETITRLSRIGYDNVLGYLTENIETIEEVKQITVSEFLQLDKKGLKVIDVRNESEYEAGAIAGAINWPLGGFDKFKALPNDAWTYYVYCAGGYRSMIFISLLKAYRKINLINIEGGYTALKPNL